MDRATEVSRAAHAAESSRLSVALEKRFEACARWLDAPEDLRRYRPAPDAWTAGEVCEHVVLANRYLLILADKIRARSRRLLAAGAPFPLRAVRTEPLERLASRELAWRHPEHMAPSGALSREGLRSELARERALCAELLAEMPSGEGTLHAIAMSVVGEKLDLYQYLHLIDLHLARHLAQMERNRAAWRARDA